MAKKNEIKYEIKTIEVRKKCPKCGKGHMVSTSKVIFSDPMMFVHKCDKCGHREKYKITYPYKKYEYHEYSGKEVVE